MLCFSIWLISDTASVPGMGLGHAHGYFISLLIKYLIRPTRTVPALKGTPEQSFKSRPGLQNNSFTMLSHHEALFLCPGRDLVTDNFLQKFPRPRLIVAERHIPAFKSRPQAKQFACSRSLLKSKCATKRIKILYSARDGTWTRTTLRSQNFKSCAATNYATRASLC